MPPDVRSVTLARDAIERGKLTQTRAVAALDDFIVRVGLLIAPELVSKCQSSLVIGNLLVGDQFLEDAGRRHDGRRSNQHRRRPSHEAARSI